MRDHCLTLGNHEKIVGWFMGCVPCQGRFHRAQVPEVASDAHLILTQSRARRNLS